MPTIFSHALLAASSAGLIKTQPGERRKLIVVGVICAVLPDADVLGFALGVAYQHPLGHRGLFHSPLFALLIALAASLLFFREHRMLSSAWWQRFAFLALAGASHGVMDAMTNGGLGIAFLAPFENGRYFLPWTPIEVSPIGLGGFFSQQGWLALQSEVIWIGLPCLAILVLIQMRKRLGNG